MKKRRKKQTHFLRESDLVTKLTLFMQQQGYRVRIEIANMGQSIDLVATKGRWVTTVEAKLRNLPRALAQCEAHEAIADYLCVALAKAPRPGKNLDLLKAKGYGLIAFDQETERFGWLVRPAWNKRIWSPQRKYWARKLKKITHG